MRSTVFSLLTFLFMSWQVCLGGVPNITTQPVNKTVVAPAAAKFTVVATSTPAPTYQWQISKNTGTDWNPITGATGAAYTTPATALAQSGWMYRVVVKSGTNSVTSDAATMTVLTKPGITTQPASQTVTAPNPVTFTIVATGVPAPTYQWQSSPNGTTWTNVLSDGTSASYTLIATSLADNGKQFRCVLTSAAGITNGAAAILTVKVAPAITTQPTSKTVVAPATAKFTMVAAGNPAPTYQWQIWKNKVTGWTNIGVATTAAYTTPATALAQSGWMYRVIVKNGIGTVTSDEVTLTVQTKPGITTQPASRTVIAPAPAAFTIVATGVPAPTYQWQISPNGTTWTNIVSGGTDSTYTLDPTGLTDNGKHYRCVLTSIAGTTTSAAATLTVKVAPSITTDPVDKTVVAPATAKFTVAATGNPAPTYQWQVWKDKDTDWINISGATAAAYTTPATALAQSGWRYRAIAKNGVGSAATSAAATLTVLTKPGITTQPAARTVTAPAAATFTIVATGEPAPTYQWQVSPNGTAWTNVASDGTDASYTLDPTGLADSGKQFRCVLTNIAGITNSAAATLTVKVAPAITTQPADKTVTVPATAKFTVVATGNPAPTYQWQLSKDNGGTWANISLATAASYTTPATALTQSGWKYRVMVTNSVASIPSDVATLTVHASPTSTFTISGNAGVDGATLSYTDGTAKTATASGTGAYSLTVHGDWTGTVTPSKTDYVFTPEKRSYANVAANQLNQDYTAAIPTTRTVTGTSIITYLPYDASTGVITPDPIPNPLHPEIYAELLDGTVFPGTFNLADGTFSIPNVPVGSYLLVYSDDHGSTAIRTDLSVVDLGWKETGRKNVARPTQPTNVTFQTTNLNAWTDNDSLIFFDFNSGLYADISNMPTPGDTALSGFTVDWQDSPNDGTLPLVDASMGDRFLMVQGVDSTLGTLNHTQIAKRRYIPGSLTIADGTGATIGGAFETIPQNYPMTFNWQRSAFAARRSDFNPNAYRQLSPQIGIADAPGLSTHGDLLTIDQLWYRNSNDSVTDDVNLGTVNLPELLAHYDREFWGGHDALMRYTLPGTSKYFERKAKMRLVTLTPPSAGNPLAPIVSTPRNLRIGSTSIFGNVTDMVPNPTISWDAPALGTVQGYQLEIRKLCADGAATKDKAVTRLLTTETHVDLPTGLLEGGRTYYFVVRAISRSGYDPAGAPFRTPEGFPRGYAENISGMVTVQALSGAPAITTQPASQILTDGQDLNLSVVATGDATLHYQWRKNNAAIGSDAATFSITSAKVADTGSYTVTVSNSAGFVDSETAYVTINAIADGSPRIIASPASVTALVGQTVTFQVGAVGDPDLHFAWKKNGTTTVGTDDPTLTFGSVGYSDAGTYTVTVSNGAGSAVSLPATLTVTSSSKEITGSRLWTFLPFNAVSGTITPVSEPATPPDPLAYIRVQLLDGTSIPGTFDSGTGNYSVLGIPASGNVWVVRGNYDYILTPKTSVDLGTFQGGRADITSPTTQTNLMLNTTGLSPWLVDGDDSNYLDDLVLYDYNSHTDFWPLENALSALPHSGDTALNAFTSNLQWNANLIDTTKGDAPALAQLTETYFGSGPGSLGATVITKEFKPSPLTIADGVTATIGGTFADVPQSTAVNINFNGAEFNTYNTPVNPHAATYDHRARMRVLDAPGFSTYGFQGIARYSMGIYGTTSNYSGGSQPAPALPLGFERAVMLEMRHYVELTAPDAIQPYRFRLNTRTYTLDLPTDVAPLRPALTPIQAPKIEGATLFDNQTISSLTPTISWDAPALGTPAGYAITVWEISRNLENQTSPVDVAKVYVGSSCTQFKVPDGILAKGKSYAFQIQARTGAGYDPESAPYKWFKFPYALADTMSGLITVQAMPGAPAITTQPSSQTANEGQPVTFTVQATGSPALSYTWYRMDSGNVITDLEQNSPTLSLSSVQASDAGRYWVVVANDFGSLQSLVATLTVEPSVPGSPAITTPPVSRTVLVGQSATFSVAASGDPTLHYAWKKNGTTPVGTDTASFTIDSAQLTDAGTYAVTVSNGLGSATSQSAVLTVSSVSKTITGSRIWTFLPFNATDGTFTSTTEPSTAPDPLNYVKAQIDDGTTIPGTYDSGTGNFSIPGIPVDASTNLWVVRDGYDYIRTPSTTLDLGVVRGGRIDADSPTSSTNLVFNTADLSSWQVDGHDDSSYTDDLIFFDYNSRNELWPLEITSGALPHEGDTALNGLTIDLLGNGNLMDTTKGDAPSLFQLKDTDFGTFGALVAKYQYKPTPLTLSDGTGATIGGSFTAIPQTTSVSVNFNAAEFDAAYGPIPINSLGDNHKARMTYFDAPGCTEYGYVGAARFTFAVYGKAGNFNAGTTTSAPDLPVGFERFVRGEARQFAIIRAPGATYTLSYRLNLRTFSQTLPTLDAPFCPLLGSIQDPTITSGTGSPSSLFLDQTVNSLTPTIAWNPPTVGTPQGYVITVFKLGVNGGHTTLADVAKLYLGGSLTQCTVPSGILQSGNAYAFLIQVRAGSEYDIESAPYKWNRFPYAYAETLSSAITVN
jgi:hypothetical protein